MKPEILVMAPIYAPVLGALEKEFSVRRLWETKHAERYLDEQCGAVRAVVTTGLRGMRGSMIDQLPKLELIACFGVPRGTIDRDSVTRRGIAVAYTPDDVTAAVGELAAGMAVSLMRGICEGDRFVRGGHWLNGAPGAGTTLVGKVCGIVGLGRIGREAATRLQAFGMTISYHGRRAKPDTAYRYFADLRSLARAADCLIVSCPETHETRNLVDAEVLDALGPQGYLVNIARGPIVNEEALLAALRDKRIAGAALDVFWNEPRVPEALMAMENVVLLPHIGSSTREVRDERGRKLMASLRAHFARQPVPHRFEV